MRQISAHELAAWLNAAKGGERSAPLLLDVREPWEFGICHIEGAHLMPMAQIPQRLGELDPDAETVVICHHGMRSQQVAIFLERNGFSSITNLSGGVAAWANTVDSTMPTY